MWKLLAKWLSPAVMGAGLVCVTMHLTNASNNLFNSMKLLDINNKPDIPEEEIQPEQQQQQQPPPQSENQQEGDSEQDDSSQQQEQNTDQQSPQQQNTEQSPSTTTSNGTSDVKEVIKFYASQINNRGEKWINTSDSLTNVHEVITSLTKLAEAMHQFSSIQAGSDSEGQEQKK